MYRLGHYVDQQWVEHSHPPAFELIQAQSGARLLKIAVPGSDIAVMKGLLSCIPGPFFILYVLVVPRGEGQPGRYQSPLIEREQAEGFLSKFRNYLKCDGRFHLWFHAPDTSATLVWDRHNIIYAYGPLADFERSVTAMGFRSGLITIPAPHEHHYRKECDEDARSVLAHFDWGRSDLQPDDEI